ncbi:MAG: hypothetical protein Fur0027_19340 [Raineya sp.]
MNKKELQTEILEKPYQQDNWLNVLKDYFGAKSFHQKPQTVSLPSNEIAESAFELGSFYTADERIVGIYEVKLTDQALIERNRVGLRNLFKSIVRYDLDAALIAYIQGEKWRFSFVSEIRTAEGKKETEPKRYTYLLGTGESCRTAAERFDKLKGKQIYLNDLFEAFSVEKLNKDFFKYYKEHYEKFWRYLAGNKQYNELLSDKRYKDDEVKREKPIRDFAKKLLGRIVFLHFLQKKGWMGVPAQNTEWKDGDSKFLQSLFANSAHKATFHSKELKTLFFQTLNTKRYNDLAPPLLGENIKIPFLNGGLFDKDISFTNDIDFPEEYFAQLLDFFEQYNFTIDENDPYDSEVGIDPEMLGHIFENLLEENKDRGTFYTPKEIVHYMCQESLIEHLYTQLNNHKPDIELFVRNKHVTATIAEHKIANEINNKLKAVKICDPAIGSGAFPMGLLKEIFDCRRLLYGYMKTNEVFDPAQVKKEIIQQNIYGVDLENGAVEIARLRFWLALVVDEKEPQPLPNLDYKIMQGNSLLESFQGIDLSKVHTVSKRITIFEPQKDIFGNIIDPQLKLTDGKVLQEKNLQQIMQDFFNETDPHKKQKQQELISQTVHEHMDYNLELWKKSLERQIAEAPKTHNQDLKATTKKKIEHLKEQLQVMIENQKKLHQLQNNSDKPYFLWHLFFADVFENGGFDIVIGNPPYIQLQKEGGRLAKELQDQNYQTFARTGDIYALFYEKGVQLLKPNGILVYITSNKWMRAGYGEKLRQFFTQYNPLILIDLGPDVFENATVDTNILLLQKNKPTQNFQLKAITLQKEDRQSIDQALQQKAIILQKLSADAWFIGSNAEQQLKEKIERIGKPLKDWDVKIYRGVLTGLNEAFIITTEKRNEILANCQDEDERERTEAIIKPILRGRDIKRYYYEWAGLWVIVIPAGWTNKVNPSSLMDYKKAEQFITQQYPALMQYLKLFEEKAKKRDDQGDYWWELRKCAYYPEFEKEKVVWAETDQSLNTVIVPSGMYLQKTCFMIISKKLKLINALLNSKISQWYIRKLSSNLGEKGMSLTKESVKEIPLPPITPANQSIVTQIELLVDKILAVNASASSASHPDADTHAWEREIDRLVYRLYELTEEEIKIIEGGA